jgi:quinol-cytochrome oxidoreductase complex cytochrome b subunit
VSAREQVAIEALPDEPGFLRLVRDALRAPIAPALRTDLVFAAALLALFLIQVFTGILLSLYYQPSTDTVAESVQFLMRDVEWGWLVRGLHHWSSPALAFVGCVHLARVAFTRSYRFGRAWIWYLGLGVLALTVLQAFSGDVLAWDDAAYWRVRRLFEGVESIPWIGATLADILRGGQEVGATTLSRMFSAHTMFVPWLLWMLLLLNAALLARGIARGAHRREEARP